MAEFAWKKGWRSADLATDTVIVYFRNVVQAFKARWQQLGGKIVTEETYQSAGGNPASWQSTVTRLNAKPADVIVTATAAAVRRAGADPQRPADAREQHAVPQLVGRRRQLLVHALDPKVTNYYYVTFASAFGDDPVRGRQRARARRTRPRSPRPAAPERSSPARPRSTGSSSR